MVDGETRKERRVGYMEAHERERPSLRKCAFVDNLVHNFVPRLLLATVLFPCLHSALPQTSSLAREFIV